MSRKTYLLLFVWIVFTCFIAFLKTKSIPTHAGFVVKTSVDEAPIQNGNLPRMLKSDVSQTNLSVHAATLAHLRINGKNKLMSAWFAGSREGAKDVQIYASFLDIDKAEHFSDGANENIWSKPVVILSRELLAEQSHTYIKKLGNPVLFQSKDGIVHLFVVATGYGGWAASKIYHLTSKAGDNFEFKQILPLSPFLNTSHLVRAIPVALDDGGFYLPIYHELANKFEIILRFDAHGELIGKIRPNHLTGTLQPSITPTSGQNCISVRRHNPAQNLLVQNCTHGGLVWLQPQNSNLLNEDNSLNIVQFNNKNYVIHNQRYQDKARYYLWLSELQSRKDKYSAVNKILIDVANESEVSYPTTLIIDNYLHIIYTYDRKSIRHIMLNISFLEQVENSAVINKCSIEYKSISEKVQQTQSVPASDLRCKETI